MSQICSRFGRGRHEKKTPGDVFNQPPGALPGRDCFDALPGDGIVESPPPPPIVKPLNSHASVLCVCFRPIHSGHQVRWTYQPGSHRRKVTQEESHTGFLIHLLSAVRALIFFARRIQPFLSLVDREVELCVLTI